MRGMATSYPARPCPASRAVSLPVFAPVHVGSTRFVSSSGHHETKPDPNETISCIGEDVRKLAMVTNPANERRAANWA
jgi:hypothetical protein